MPQRGSRVGQRRPPSEGQRERHHGHHAGHAQVCPAPALGLYEVLHDGRQRSGAGSCHTQSSPPRSAAMTSEPQRGVGDEWCGNVAELATPTRRPWARLPEACSAWLATAYPSPSEDPPPTTGATTPKRSERRPMTMPPKPQADHRHGVRQRGGRTRDAELRLDGRQRHIMIHMPTPPMVDTNSAAKSRSGEGVGGSGRHARGPHRADDFSTAGSITMAWYSWHCCLCDRSRGCVIG